MWTPHFHLRPEQINRSVFFFSYSVRLLQAVRTPLLGAPPRIHAGPKHRHGDFVLSSEAAAEKHMAQVQHNMWVTNVTGAVLSIITGGGKSVEIQVIAD